MSECDDDCYLYKFHASFMITSLVLLLCSGVLISMIFKRHMVSRMIHYLIQIIGSISSVVGILIVVVNDGFTWGIHQVIGFSFLLILVVQVVFGIIYASSYNPLKIQLTCFPDLAHLWIGKLLIVVGIVNVYIGSGGEVFNFRLSVY
eukprot:TRINITY_DN4623_c0_g1_i2.p1 TRINITY_DN4623_c0_g1~~TRINITY_DN4623_c0_g1_i2.p1  ORF type:complete len:147 (+),score=12.42 TRINITY_DN4623_c0_g1_i2:60-500(+)